MNLTAISNPFMFQMKEGYNLDTVDRNIHIKED